LKAFKVFEVQNFERGVDPMDSMKLGDVKGRLLEKYKKETFQTMVEIINTYGGEGPYFITEDIGLSQRDGFKIVFYQYDPIQSRFKISEDRVRYYIEYNNETERFFVGWEQFDIDGKWRDRQWTGTIPFSNKNIQSIIEAKHILIDYIKSNKPIEGTLNLP
jgi:hypothetical protein